MEGEGEREEGKKENRSLSPLFGGCGGRTDWSSFDNKDAPTLALVSAPSATGVCKKARVPPQTRLRQEGSEGCKRGERPPEGLS